MFNSNHLFKKSFLNNAYSDLTFYVGDWPESKGPVDKTKLLRVPAHKCIITTASPLFEQLWQNETEVIIADVDPLNFLYFLR